MGCSKPSLESQTMDRYHQLSWNTVARLPTISCSKCWF